MYHEPLNCNAWPTLRLLIAYCLLKKPTSTLGTFHFVLLSQGKAHNPQLTVCLAILLPPSLNHDTQVYVKTPLLKTTISVSLTWPVLKSFSALNPLTPVWPEPRESPQADKGSNIKLYISVLSMTHRKTMMTGLTSRGKYVSFTMSLSLACLFQ